MIDLIDLVNRRSEQALVLSLDAEKAFDRLGWPFLFATLQKFGISGGFLTALRGLYSAPTASIKLPHSSSPTFPLFNGTRQGCPLSPLVFALCIEPLAALIRGDPDVSGIALHDREFKICLFADDVLLTLSRPLLSLPALYRILHTYGVVSGYKVNLSKSEALPLNLPPAVISLLRADFSFRWSSSAISYLGISLSSRYSTLYSENFPALFRELRALMERWRPQYISFFGRIAAVKMTILPKLLYYFETLPVRVPLAALRSFQSAIFRFIWDAKRHRLPMSVMLSSRSAGGLGVPDVVKYYWSAHLRHLVAWATYPAYSKWMELEKLWLAPIHPNAFLWSPIPLPSPHPLLGPMTFSRYVWSYCSRRFGLSSVLSPLRSFLYNPAFPPGLESAMVRTWGSRGLFCWADVVDPCTRSLLSFAQLADRRGLPSSEGIRYAQLRHFLSSDRSSLTVSVPTGFERLCRCGPQEKGLLSSIYSFLLSPPGAPLPSHRYMTRWEEELGSPISSSQWAIIWDRAARSSICTAYKETQYKMLMGWYHTPVLLNRLNPVIPPQCWRCGVGLGTVFHIFWSCPLIVGFWGRVQALVHSVLGVLIPLDPRVYLLYLSPAAVRGRPFRLFMHMTLAAKTLIAKNWKLTLPPSEDALTSRIREIRSLESLTASLNNAVPKFQSVWEPWDQFTDRQPP